MAADQEIGGSATSQKNLEHIEIPKILARMRILFSNVFIFFSRARERERGRKKSVFHIYIKKD